MRLTVGRAGLLRSQVNTSLGILFIGSVALWAGITIWHVAHGTDPLSKAFEAMLYRSELY